MEVEPDNHHEDEVEHERYDDADQENQIQQKSSSHKHHQKSVTATDAEFMEWASADASTTDANVLDLHKSNLLRLQIQELLQETLLSLDSTDHSLVTSTTSTATAGASNTTPVTAPKWTQGAQEYLQSLTTILETKISLQATKEPISIDDPESPFWMESSKVSTSTLPPTLQTLTVRPGMTLETNIGFTKPVGNAHVIPTLPLWVLLPTSALLEPKDYLKQKYFQKRNAIIWYVAKQLTNNKKFASKVGTVYWRGSRRHPTLLIIPPTTEPIKTSDNNNHKKKKKKRSKSNDDASTSKPKKLRFRVELHFGMDNLDWIQPQIRLVPNRCNLGGGSSTSHYYNYQLTQDASHLFTAKAVMEGADSTTTSNSKFQLKEMYPHLNEVIVLAKVWSLQRGLLNRHDGLTMDHIALLVLYMYRTKLIGPRMGAPQVLSAFFKLLAETNWIGEGTAADNKSRDERDHPNDEQNLIRKAPHEGYQENGANRSGKRTVLVLPMKEGESLAQTTANASMAQIYAKQTATSPLTPDDPKTLLALYETTYTLGPVFLDSSMTHNFFGQVSPACIRLLQREAQKGLQYLHSKSHEKPFQLLFMSEARFHSKSRYDAYMKIPLKDISFKNESNLWGEDRSDVGDYESIARGMVRVLKLALGDRVSDVQLLSTGNGNVSSFASATTSEIDIRDSDEIPVFPIDTTKTEHHLTAPNGHDHLVLGLSINSNTCFRVVDRGPPAEDNQATFRFLQLWGKERAELRRFKDGAIVHAVVWDESTSLEEIASDGDYTRFQNDDKVLGGIVERVVRHILRTHFVKKKKPVTASFALRDILSTVDGVIPDENKEVVTFNPLVAHRLVIKAFEELSSFLREESLPSISVQGSDTKRSRLGIPLAIDAVEPLDPALRYAELFPPIPHPFLGGSALPGIHKVSGAVCSSPVQIQIRFGSSSKWPTDLKAMGAAKTAMLLQLADGIERLKDAGRAKGFTGPVVVTPEYVDLCYKGYVFRVLVRADPQLKLLRELSRPSDEAANLLKVLTRKHVISAKHHSMVHAVYTSHPSSSMVVRVIRRWMSAHLFSGMIPLEAVELLVCHVYTGKDFPFDPPATVVSGLQRFFDLLSSYNWEGEPLIVDPQGHFDDSHRRDIAKEFEAVRGPQGNRGPAMFIITPNDWVMSDEESNTLPPKASAVSSVGSKNKSSMWYPTFTSHTPELVVLARARQLAKRCGAFLSQSLLGDSTSMGQRWPSLFHESSESFRAYSVLLRVDPEYVLDEESSSSAASAVVRRNEKLGVWQSSYSRSMYRRYYGPATMQLKLFKNLISQNSQSPTILLEFNPLDELVKQLRQALGQLAVFWYNEHCPDVVAVLWRPNLFSGKPFSAVSSEYMRPVTEDQWQKDTLTTVSVSDILAEMSSYSQDIIVDQKVFDSGMTITPAVTKKTAKKRKLEQQATESSSSSEDGNVSNDDTSHSQDDSDDGSEE